MESKVFKLLSFIFILIQLLFVAGLAKRDIPSVQNSSPFDFIKQLNGCHKGMKVKGVHQLKNYLKQFGYLENPNQDDDFDDALESAIKTYQQNYHINPTGQIDDAIISKMTTPRCGVPDIVNGTNTMVNKNHVSVSSPGSNIHTVSHYSFFSGNPKWPATKTVLTYLFLSNTSQIARDATIRAFQKWDSATRFSFSPAPRGQLPDLDIGFYGRGNHGDGFPFDGRFGVLAHAFAPTRGKFHFDADEQWVVGSVPDSIDLESIALHEIGHLLGLGHSSVETAVMFSGLAGGQVKTTLQQDDIDGIRALYA